MFTEFILGSVLLLIIVYFTKQKKHGKTLPPGPIRWPLIGNVVEIAIANIEYPHLAIRKLSDKYGDIMSLAFGSHFTIVLSSYEVMKEILVKPDASGRYEYPFVLGRNFDKSNMGLIWNYGESWKEIRHFLTKSLKTFGYGKVNSMEVIIQEEMNDFVQELSENIQNNPEGVHQIDPWSLGVSAVNILWSFVAGYRFSLKDKRLLTIVKLNENILEAMGYNNRYMAFPFVKTLFPKWSKWPEHLKAFKQLQDFMRESIKEIKIKRASRPNPEPESFIEAFMDEIEKSQRTNDNETSFTEEQLLSTLADLFLAGSETTSTSVNWIIVYLTLHPEVQEKIYQEILQVCGNGTLSLNDASKMPYTKATILEVLRVSNVVPLPAPRSALRDIPVRDYVIPKGAAIMFNFDSVFNDKKHWGDPEIFRPERFLEKTSVGYNIVNTERMSAFGFGRRSCIGESLVSDSLFMYTTTICKHFTLESVPGQEPSTKPVTGPTLSPQRFVLNMKKRF